MKPTAQRPAPLQARRPIAPRCRLAGEAGDAVGRAVLAGAVGIALWTGAGGCGGPAYRNARLDRYDPAAGYRFDVLSPGPANSDETFICLTFSGGGARAAALSYGVLQELKDTPLPARGVHGAHDPGPSGPNLLHEVDVISSVSGGSFTALGYGLWRDELFDGRYEAKFLKRDMEWELVCHLLAPKNLLLLPFILLDTIDVAADFYDRCIFDESRYADLVERGQRPYIVVNATNLAQGRRFEFTQGDFDVLGSDLGGMPLGYSAAASSAFPIVFSPMRLRYFPSPEGASILESILTAPDAATCDERRCRWASSLIPDPRAGAPPCFDLDEPRHRYCYLVDGGLADNLGLMHVIQEYQHGYIARRLSEGRIRRLLLIIVDAGNRPRETIEQEPSSPGLLTVGYKTAITGIDNHNETMVQLVRLLLDGHEASREAYDRCRAALQEVCPEAAAPAEIVAGGVEAYVVHIDLRDLTDEREREGCLCMPTRFKLPDEDIDLLIRSGRALLRSNAEFQRFLEASQGEGRGAGAGVGGGS